MRRAAYWEFLRPDRFYGLQPAFLMVAGAMIAMALGYALPQGTAPIGAQTALIGLFAGLPLAGLAWFWRHRAMQVIIRERHLREAAERRARQQVVRDPHTGLLHLDAFRARASQLMQAAIDPGQQAGVLIVQIVEQGRDGAAAPTKDHDRAMLWAAGLIERVVRRTDLVARLDTDRLAIFVTKGHDGALGQIRDRLLLKAMQEVGKPRSSLRLQAAVANGPAQTADLDVLLQTALDNLQQADHLRAADATDSH